MPKGTKIKKREVISSHAGIKVGDTVKLIGAEMPRTPGKVKAIFLSKYSTGSDDMTYSVHVKNEAERNALQSWDVYRYELEKV